MPMAYSVAKWYPRLGIVLWILVLHLPCVSSLFLIFGLSLSNLAFGQPLDSIKLKTDIMNRKRELIGRADLTVNDQAAVLTVALWQITPGWHAMHFHSHGDCSDPLDGFIKSGGHLSVHDHQHGVASAGGFHTGDLANIYAHDIRRPTVKVPQVLVTQILPWINRSMLTQSFALIIHEGPDDYLSNPAGNAGPREACGVFEFPKVSD